VLRTVSKLNYGWIVHYILIGHRNLIFCCRGGLCPVISESSSLVLRWFDVIALTWPLWKWVSGWPFCKQPCDNTLLPCLVGNKLLYVRSTSFANSLHLLLKSFDPTNWMFSVLRFFKHPQKEKKEKS
jgi:hypothetical protein